MKARFMWEVTNIHGDSWVQAGLPKNPKHKVIRVLVMRKEVRSK